MPEAGRASVKFVGDYSALMAGLTSTLGGSKLKSVGLKAGGALAAGFVASKAVDELMKAVNVTKEFDKQISSLGAVAGASNKQMEALRKQAIKMGADTVFSATEAAQAQTELAKGGLNASQILGGALKSSLDLAAAGELDLADAAETTVNAMQLFGLAGRDTSKIADMLATAANKTTADVLDFAMSLKQGGAVAKTAGYSLNDTVVVLEALAEAGIKNSDAGTSMKAALIQLLNPTKKQAELAEKLHISWLSQNGELKTAVGISKQLKTATEGMSKAERTKTLAILAGTDGFRTLSALYDAGVGKLRAYARENEKSGTAAEVASRKTDNLAGDVEQLSGAWQTFQINVGTALTPVLRTATQTATDLVDALNSINLNAEIGNTDTTWAETLGKSFEVLKGTLQLPFDADGGIKRIVNAFAGDKHEISRIQATIKARMAAAGALKRASIITREARDRAAGATRGEKRAEDDLRRARRRHGDGSSEVLEAEIRLQRAKRRTIRLTEAAKRAERLEGIERQVVASQTRNQVVQEKARIGALNRRIRVLGRAREVEIANNGYTKKARDIEAQIIDKIKSRNDTQKRLNNVLGDAARQVGPKFARSLRDINTKAATMEAALGRLPSKADMFRGALGQLPGPMRTVGSTSKIQFGKAETSVGDFAEALNNKRRQINSNMRSMPTVQVSATDRMIQDFAEKVGVIKNDGRPQSKRRGGLVELLRQGFRQGGVPVAVSPGEMFKTPSGEMGVVPGRPTAADSVLTSMPVGTKVFTFDGQRRLAEGASEAEALRRQAPHFASGGIVKPEVFGGSPKARELANTAIGSLHDKATAKLKKERQEAAAANVSGNGINGLVPQVKKALAFATAHGWHGTVSSGFRSYAEQAALYAAYLNGTGNLAAKPGTSNHEGGQAVDVTDYDAFGAAMGQMGPGRLYSRISGEPWHYSVTGYQLGGLVEAIQRLVGGGQVGVYRGKVTWFNGGATAGGSDTSKPGLALNLNPGSDSGWNNSKTQKWMTASRAGRPYYADVGIGGKSAILPLTDLGPAGWTHNMIDVTEGGVSKLGFSTGNFPSGTEGVAWLLGQNPRPRKGSPSWTGGAGASGMSAAEKAKAASKSRRENREKRVKELLRKGSYWPLFNLFANYGDFERRASKYGGVGPGMDEASSFLSRVGAAASVANPNNRLGRLGSVARWLIGNVDMTGVEDANERLARRLSTVQDRSGKRASKRRDRILSKIARFGEDSPWGKRLNKNASWIELLTERIGNAEREHGAPWSAGGSEYTDAEVANEVGLNRRKLTAENRRYRMFTAAIPYFTAAADRYRKLIDRAGPKDRWKVPGWRKGLRGATANLKAARSGLNSLVGLTGDGGTRGDTYFRLRELGFTDTVEKVAAATANAGISIGDLRGIVDFAALGGYRDMPILHRGGIYRAAPGQTEGPALLQDGETVRTKEQERALRSGNVTFQVKFRDDRLKDLIEITMDDRDREVDQHMKAAGV